jgi:alpha-mannosidase
VTGTTLENEFYKVTVDPVTGAVSGILDKQAGRELVDQEAVHTVNQLVARDTATGRLETAASAEVRVGETGPILGSLVVTTSAFGCPQVTQEIVLYHGIRRVEFRNRILKDSTPCMEVYIAFPFKVENPRFAFESSNAVMKPFENQFPGSNTNYYAMQHWADVSDGDFGIAFSALESHMIELGGMWPLYVSQAHHGVDPHDYGSPFVQPNQMTKGHMYSLAIDSNFRTNFEPAQQAEVLLRYAIASHAGDWTGGAPRELGWSFANPVMASLVDMREEAQGKRAPSGSFCSIDKSNVVLSALKRAEDGDGIVARLIETGGVDTDVTLTLPTVAIREAMRANLGEEDVSKLDCGRHDVTVRVRAFGITTVRMRMA